jgi:hypothetical protein
MDLAHDKIKRLILALQALKEAIIKTMAPKVQVHDSVLSALVLAE